uniref:Uncharacterized protein n=1 Tax=Marseillevirus LCMAC201 TaxID=2506605 RepID=A0A481YX55_9VIRU|nr:MAG: hypothetical protein LCMAC201_03810 [Marseillevirus LCMAC201]
MLYNVCFSDELFSGGNLKVDVEGTFTSLDDFLQVLLTLEITLDREHIGTEEGGRFYTKSVKNYLHL